MGVAVLVLKTESFTIEMGDYCTGYVSTIIFNTCIFEKIYCSDSGTELLKSLPRIIMQQCVEKSRPDLLEKYMSELKGVAWKYLETEDLFLKLATKIDEFCKNPNSVNYIQFYL